MKLVNFRLSLAGRSTRVNRANIVGFEVPDARLVYTNVLLDTGAVVGLNGISIDEAIKILETFDKENNNAS